MSGFNSCFASLYKISSFFNSPGPDSADNQKGLLGGKKTTLDHEGCAEQLKRIAPPAYGGAIVGLITVCATHDLGWSMAEIICSGAGSTLLVGGMMHFGANYYRSQMNSAESSQTNAKKKAEEKIKLNSLDEKPVVKQSDGNHVVLNINDENQGLISLSVGNNDATLYSNMKI